MLSVPEVGRARTLTPRYVSTNLPFVETYELVLEALGDKTRRQIVQCLRERPASVGEIAARIPVSRPAVSQHLRVLRDCELVTSETDGTRNVYRLQPRGLETLRHWLDDYWGAVLESFAAYVESQTEVEGNEEVEKGTRHV
jgi:DNA-binding transcriptional ArsR family regulator